MATINNLINNISNQNISFFFQNKITSFKPEHDVFNNTVKEDEPYANPIKIGFAELKNNEELLVFTCEYNKEITARSAKKQQFEIAKKVLKEDFKDGAIFIFYDAQGNFRFSFIRRNYGDKTSKYSNWKRYTYYVSPAETNKTFKNRIDSCSFKDLDSIQEAFSVEKLTKDFYNELFAWYKWALSDEMGITFPNNTEITEDDRVKLEEQIIRLITRLLFVWFVKQKKLVPNTLFDTHELSKILIDFNANDKNDGNYYNAILQNLFFATLNKEITERAFAKKVDDRDIKTNYRYAEMFNLSEQEVIDLFKPIPFLNGGLFECLDKTMKMDGVQYALDGFSRNATKAANGNFRHRAFIPNCVFFDEEKGIIPLLKRYNFTVEENAPNEIQVALDPELLGKVFENLLGAFNPETKDTARKQSGSFYTPREIVDYMVNESLSSYLLTHFPKLQETLIQSLFQEEELPDELKNNHTLCEQISNTLRHVKILDPACGSGAFPMGILNKLVAVLEKLDCKNEQTIHDLKLHLIEECIYGIDIQNIATQISKLRFFISLVVEQGDIDLSKPEDNYGVLTLPNLETKFVSANTLIGIKRKPAQINLFEDPDIETTKQQLLAIRKEHFYAKTVGAKKRLRDQDAALRDKLTKLLQENNEFASEDAIQFSQWNPYDQNTSSPFFDTGWMFGLEEGFDVVIANPPYIEAKKLKHISSQLKSYSVYSGTTDLSSYFFEKGIDMCKTNGVLCYINTNKFFNTGYGKFLRSFLLNYQIEALLNFEQVEVFENVLVSSVIINITKQKGKPKDFQYKKFYKLKHEEFKKKFKKEAWKNHYYNQGDLTDDEWSFADSTNLKIKKKIEENSILLKNIEGISIYRGITTGYDPAFVINDKSKLKIENVSIIKKLLKGKEIKRFYNKRANEKLLFIPWHYPLHNENISGASEEAAEKLKSEEPILYEHLLSHYKGLNKRNKSETGIRYEWYALQRCAASYYPLFDKNKIMWPLTADKWGFALDLENHFLTSGGFFLVSSELSLYYILSLLNSKLMNYYFKFIGVMTAGGAYTLKKATIEEFPIIKIEDSSLFDFITSLIIYLHNPKSEQINETIKNIQIAKFFEEVIDGCVFELYFKDHMLEKDIHIIALVQQEVNIVFGDTPFANIDDDKKAKSIWKLYKTLSHPDHPVRIKILKFPIVSPNILKPILQS